MCVPSDLWRLRLSRQLALIADWKRKFFNDDGEGKYFDRSAEHLINKKLVGGFKTEA